MRKTIILAVTAAFLLLAGGYAAAATSVAWIAPPNGASFPVGTVVNPIGQAGATGVIGGTGLDLAIVMDSSGSMTTIQSGKSRAQWQKEAAIALVNALPVPTTSVAIIEFDSSASVVRVLTQLTSDNSATIASINSVDASGGTTIGAGIAAAQGELTSARHTAGRLQSMVVMSDGFTSGNPEANAVTAIAAGVDSIHTVGLPGHDAATMRNIADGPDDVVGTADDYGVYTDASNIATLIGLFSGTGGSLVGLDHVDITLPDGTPINSIPTDGLGNFTLPNWSLVLGPNTFTATAYGTDGTSGMASLTLYGQPTGVPEPGTLLLLGAGLLGLAGWGRKRLLA